MAWSIRSASDCEREALDKWGEAEWERRMVVVEQKCSELEDLDGFETGCIIGGQFDVIARALNQEQFDKMAGMSVVMWRRLVERLILN